MTDIARNAAPVTGGLLGRVRQLNARLEAADRLADLLDGELHAHGWPDAVGRVELTQALLDYRQAGEVEQ